MTKELVDNSLIDDTDEGIFEYQLKELVEYELASKKHNSKVKTLKDFSPEEIKELEKQYGAKIKQK